MLYLFHGTDTQASYDACVSFGEGLAKAQPPTIYNADEYTSEELQSIIQNNSLFADTRVIILKRTLNRHEELLPEIAACAKQDDILCWEDNAITGLGKYFTKSHQQQFTVAREKQLSEKDERNKIYAFSDAWARRDWKGAIQKYHELLRGGAAAEQLFWAIHWQARTLVLVQNDQKGELTKKLHPYVVQKTKQLGTFRDVRAAHHAVLQLQQIDHKTKTASLEVEYALLFFLLTM